MISKDDPAHSEQRKLISERFTPRAVQAREDEIRELVVSCIERVRRHGVAEAVHALAARIPATLTCRLIGFPDAYWTLLDDWSSKLMRVDVVYRDLPSMNDSMLAMIDLGEGARALFDGRKRAPRDDLMSIWARSSLGGRPLDFETVHWELGLVIPGGVDTTRTTIARSLILLAERPALLTQMAEDPGIIPSAVEELLRYLTPLNQTFRTAAVRRPRWGGRRFRLEDASASSIRPRIGTTHSSTGPTRSTSGGTRIRTWRSASARISASVRIWPD